MRLKIKNSVITIPDKLIKQLNELDVETANAINVLINKGERIISQKNRIQQELHQKLNKIKLKRKYKMQLIS
jgi:antitoxin component of MazEF toxin-antitoxin module